MFGPMQAAFGRSFIKALGIAFMAFCPYNIYNL
jgi:hypothetical protein